MAWWLMFPLLPGITIINDPQLLTWQPLLQILLNLGWNKSLVASKHSSPAAEVNKLSIQFIRFIFDIAAVVPNNTTITNSKIL